MSAYHVPKDTPWGPAQQVTIVADGIGLVSCAGHGGFHLSPQRNALVPGPLRNRSGWYEEDVEAHIVWWVFADELAATHHCSGDSPRSPWSDPDAARENAAGVLRQWLPDQWAAATGEPVPEAESPLLQQRRFLAEHRDAWVAIAAVGASARADLRPGEVAVTCAPGGDMRSRRRRVFAVPADEYDRRGQRFVADPARHRDLGAR